MRRACGNGIGRLGPSALAGVALCLIAGCGRIERTDLLGGDATVADASPNAFGFPAPNLDRAKRDAFFVGNSFFKNNWVPAPASTAARDGLGPLFNARSCSACHLKDGRGEPPEPGRGMVSMLVRLSVSGNGTGPVPEPTYGGQFQTMSVPGMRAEGFATVHWDEISDRYATGEPFTLLRPRVELSALGYGPMQAETMQSARVAPHLIGLGLLEAIDEAAIVARADPDDRDGDGISGRPNWVDDGSGVRRLGRFGWKANQPDIARQVAAAFLGDMGITSATFPDHGHGAGQAHELADCPSGGDPEIEPDTLAAVVLYSQVLAVPQQRAPTDPEVQRGSALFQTMGCASCHVTAWRTGQHPDFPEFSNQTIRPYTDLLLHDMGEALADGRPDHEANGREWRTPPLWGLGLVKTVNGHTRLLHDGRARGMAEAILWHGGEAEASREAFRELPEADRAAVIRFLESL